MPSLVCVLCVLTRVLFHPLVLLAPEGGSHVQGDFLCVSRGAGRSAQALVVQVLSKHSFCEPGARRLVAKSCPWLSVIWKYLGDRTFQFPLPGFCIAIWCQINAHIYYRCVPDVCREIVLGSPLISLTS